MRILDGPVAFDPPPRLIAIDVDGTLLTSDHRVTAATWRSLEQLAPRVAFALASARAPAELDDLLRVLPAVRFAIAYQGAWVGEWDGDRFVTLQETRVRLATARDVAQRGLDLGLTLGWFEGLEWWVAGMDDMVRRHVAITGLQPHVDPATPRRASEPHKLMFIAATDELQHHIRSLARTLPIDCAAHLSHEDYLEVTAANVDKGRALRTLAAHLSIPMAATMAFGDGDNDIPLIAAAGHGIAVASGTPGAKGAAKWVTRGNDEEGVAFALRSLLPVAEALPRAGKGGSRQS